MQVCTHTTYSHQIRGQTNQSNQFPSGIVTMRSQSAAMCVFVCTDYHSRLTVSPSASPAFPAPVSFTHHPHPRLVDPEQEWFDKLCKHVDNWHGEMFRQSSWPTLIKQITYVKQEPRGKCQNPFNNVIFNQFSQPDFCLLISFYCKSNSVCLNFVDHVIHISL